MAFAIAAAITAGTGLATCRIHPSHNDMGKREGFLLTASVWIVFSAFGMLPMIFSPFAHMSVTDAFFEAMSGFTTTGASLIDPSGTIPNSIHIWRCLSQWIGGMGIILFTLAVIPMLNHSGGMQMFNAEVTGITHDKIRPRISQTAQKPVERIYHTHPHGHAHAVGRPHESVRCRLSRHVDAVDWRILDIARRGSTPGIRPT